MNIAIQTHYLSDNSEVTSVLVEANGALIRFHCVDSVSAHFLRQQIETSVIDAEAEFLRLTETPLL